MEDYEKHQYFLVQKKKKKKSYKMPYLELESQIFHDSDLPKRSTSF